MKKKVLIISKASNEYTTEKVIDWIRFFGHDSIRLNGDDFEELTKSISLECKRSCIINIGKNKLQTNFYSIWLRRWSDFQTAESLRESSIKLKLNPKLIMTLYECFTEDMATVGGFILNTFKSKKQLTYLHQLTVNKLNVLNLARKTGLRTPNFILTNRKEHLINFIKSNVIVKDLSSNFSLVINNTILASYGKLLSANKINKIPATFSLSFFQEYIEKEIEIRSFILNKNIYSMAIFSQNNPRTRVDFRNYDNIKPNRTVPYKLPIEIEGKIINLMTALKLNTGSIDLVKNKKGQYFFLEINPVGQFGKVSFSCNYNLECLIAKYLVH